MKSVQKKFYNKHTKKDMLYFYFLDTQDKIPQMQFTCM
jgi:hypothetical protein